ncbi:MAG: MDR/zinc-dependent alcohol dehydrogenase-like family protein [Solirubrobacterales bacterium]
MMKAVRFENQTLEIIEVPIPVPRPGEALVKTVISGICNTDLELYQGYYDFAGIAGHELVGRVEQADDYPMLVGRRVVIAINRGCGTCETCLSIGSEHCPSRKALGIHDWDGAFAEYVLAPLRNLHLVPDEVPDQIAVFAEPLAAALEITHQVPIKKETRTLVLGDGKLGLLSALVLRHFTDELTLAGRNPKHLASAANVGLDTLEIVGKRSGSMTSRYDLVIEATGSPTGVQSALEAVRPRGTLVVKTTSHQLSQIDLNRVVVDEITIIGSRCGNMVEALDYLQARKVDPTPLIEQIYPFSRFEEAFQHAIRPVTGKILVTFSPERK